MKINNVSINPTVTNPVIPSQGAWRLRLPWFKSSPNEADPAGNPKPKKSRAVNEVIAPLKIKGKKVNAAVIAFGSTWRTIIDRSWSPKAFAARTYSKFRVRKNSARTTETTLIQLKAARQASSQKKLGSTMLARMINMIKIGKPDQISTTL